MSRPYVDLMVEDVKGDANVTLMNTFGFSALLHLIIYSRPDDAKAFKELLTSDAYARLNKMYKFKATEQELSKGTFHKRTKPTEFEDKDIAF